jgi:hypothetical protein
LSFSSIVGLYAYNLEFKTNAGKQVPGFSSLWHVHRWH